jgi:phosphoglycolate phosphatase-like HAD superfamily hydrolase
MRIEKLVLFDLDGTILWTNGAGRRAIREALIDEMGTAGPIESYSFAGKTDPQIVRDLLMAAGHPHADSDSHVARVCRRYEELLRSELAAPSRDLRVYVGVEELLAVLTARADTVVGLLTGNLEEGAALKLEAVGIDVKQFRVGAFGSDASDRADLPAIAAERAAPLMGWVPQGDNVVIIGDTPADVTCGRGIQARAIAVATGPYDIDQLAAAGPYALFRDLSNTARVIEAIYR